MKLTPARRHAMPRSEFAGPHESFPLNDRTHDRMALSGATRSYNAGNITRSTENRIKSEARAKLSHPHKNLGGYLHPKKGR